MKDAQIIIEKMRRQASNIFSGKFLKAVEVILTYGEMQISIENTAKYLEAAENFLEVLDK